MYSRIACGLYSSRKHCGSTIQEKNFDTNQQFIPVRTVEIRIVTEPQGEENLRSERKKGVGAFIREVLRNGGAALQIL